jgi:hypothetical protein
VCLIKKLVLPKKWKDKLAQDLMDSNIRQYCEGKVKYPDFDDVFSESMYRMMRMDDEKLKDIYDRKKHLDYFFLVVRNQIHNYNRASNRFTFLEFSDEFEVEDTPYHESGAEILDVIDEWAEDFNSGWWYHSRIMKLYAEEGSIRRVHKKTKIPYANVSITIDEFRDWVIGLAEDLGLDI